ncbi:hypothetical protein DYB32_005374, partial [Aphanomyces invadans]
TVNLRAARGVHGAHGSEFNLRSVLLDTQGPEIRGGSFADGNKVTLTKGDQITLTTDERFKKSSTKELLYVTYAKLAETVSPGSTVLLDDGLISLTVESIENGQVTSLHRILARSMTARLTCGGQVHCRVENTETLGNRKGVNLPGLVVDLPALTDKDKADVEFGIKHDMDFVAVSFVRSAADIHAVQEFVKATMIKYWPADHPSPKLIAKIENHQGVSNFDEILDVADGIMVARGDLGVEIPLAEVFTCQKMMVSKANAVAAVNVAYELKAKLIVALTKDGTLARDVAKYKPSVPVMSYTPSRKVGRQLQLHRALEDAVKMGWTKKGDKVVVLSNDDEAAPQQFIMRIETIVQFQEGVYFEVHTLIPRMYANNFDLFPFQVSYVGCHAVPSDGKFDRGCTVAALDDAAKAGHVAIVRFLLVNRTEGGSAYLPDDVAAAGHLGVLHMLHDAGMRCTSDAMDRAAGHGHFDLVVCLHELDGCSSRAMDLAAENGFMNVVEFLHNTRHEGCTTYAMDRAAKNGFLDVVRFLHTSRDEGCTTNAVDWAARNNQVEVVLFLCTHRHEGFTHRAVVDAQTMGHAAVTSILMQHSHLNTTTTMSCSF